MSGKKKYIFLLLIDIILINVSVMVALFLRLEITPSELWQTEFLRSFLIGIPVLSLIYICMTLIFKTYSVLWVFASSRDLVTLNFVCAISALLYMLVAYIAGILLPRSVYPIGALIMMILITGTRLLDRVYTRQRMNGEKKSEIPGRHLLIIGAGMAGNMLIHDIKQHSPSQKELWVIDDDREKTGKYIYGAKVVGTRENIADAVREYGIDTIIFAIPSCPEGERSELLRICTDTGCEVLTMPSIEQVVCGRDSVINLRKLEVEDLLGRKAVDIHAETVSGYICGKRVLVTGGGGSIGSELCRQIASFGPAQLIIFDFYENTTYTLENELRANYPDLDIRVLIGSVRDSKRLDAVFSHYRPEIVYHAAAHKHVPLMEDSPNEAIKNNVFGTLKTVQAADRYGVERFVLISTDKAVNPTNIMGASKRLCEMIVQSYNKRSSTAFAAVRFGNVLGSNGSVIPIFRKQIENGGPVTVTHPEIIRYFMTIPEAVSLVLNAGAYAGGGEIFVLDMGKPMKILDLAENMIRLAGLRPYEDIDIKFTGLRPGEKLYEELLMNDEGLRSTDNELIFVGHPMDFDEDELMNELDKLREVMYDEDCDIRALVKRLVPTYKPSGESARLSDASVK